MSQLIPILFVDDDGNVLSAYRRQLRGTYDIHTHTKPREALELLKGSNFAVIVSDMRMPDMDGIAFLKEAQKIAPNSIRVMLTGNADRDTAVRSVNEGQIFRFISKPCNGEELENILVAAARQYQLETAERDLLQRTLSGSVKLLTDLLALGAPAIFGKNLAVRELVKLVATKYIIPNSWEIELAAMVADLGVLTIPPALIAKASSGAELTNKEKDALAGVALASQRLVHNIPRLEGVASILGILGDTNELNNTKARTQPGEALYSARLLKVLRTISSLENNGKSKLDIVIELQKNQIGWETEIFKILTELFQSTTAPKTKETADKPFEVSVANLCTGQKLLSNVETIDGVLLMTSGHVLAPSHIEKIRSYASLVGVKEPILVNARIPTEV